VACAPPTSGEALVLGMDKTTAAMNAKSRDVNDRLKRNFIEMFNVERIQIMSKLLAVFLDTWRDSLRWG